MACQPHHPVRTQTRTHRASAVASELPPDLPRAPVASFGFRPPPKLSACSWLYMGAPISSSSLQRCPEEAMQEYEYPH